MFALSLLPFLFNQQQQPAQKPVEVKKDYTIQIIAIVSLVVIGFILIAGSKKGN